jgi:hypothetical protein
MTRAPKTWANLPLFATDEDIGEAVLGYDRRRDFTGLASLHERMGMPKLDPVWGGRYVPAVKAYLDSDYGLSTVTPLAPNGIEGSFHGKRKTAGKPRSEVAKSEDRSNGPVLVR